MATKKVEKDVVESVESEVKLVDVEYVLGSANTTYYGNGFKVEFVNGKASVVSEVANALKEDGVIK